MEQNKLLKKLENGEKDDYLFNLNIAALNLNGREGIVIPTSMISQLAKILEQTGSVEIDTYSGLPSVMSILRIVQISKDVKKEIQELKSKISTEFKEEGKSLEQMIVERIKSKIYSFDTLEANEMISEKTPFYEILNTEFVLRDRLYLLRAIESSPFSLDPQVRMGYDSVGVSEYYRGLCTITGFDPKENKFTGYKMVMNFFDKGRKRVMVRDKDGLWNFKHEELLKKQFSTGSLGSIYKEFSGIKYVWLEKVIKSTFGPYLDKNTGEVAGLALPENIFEGSPNAYVLNVSCESIETAAAMHQGFKRTDTEILGKSKTEYKMVHTNPDALQRLKDFYKDDENVKVIT